MVSLWRRFTGPRSGSTARRRSFPRETMGYRIRTIIAFVERKAGPVAARLFPSFIYTHYAYIAFIAILGSVLIYPERNIPYIDALFLASGAATQAGLNTVNLNDLALYQQIVIYVMCFMSTPIFIHGGILLLRLYWFERYFDGIKESSKLNHKMRRTATLAAMNSQLTNEKLTKSRAAAMKAAGNPEGFTSSHDFYTAAPTLEAGAGGSPSNKTETSSDSGHANNYTAATTLVPGENANGAATAENHRNASRDEMSRDVSDDGSQQYNNVHHMSEPSDSEDDGRHRAAADTSSGSGASQHAAAPDRDIRFAEDLPHPDKRQQEMEPQDMYMSIAMMANNHKLQHPNDNDDEAGPALVIKGPAEREARRRHRQHRQHRHRKLGRRHRKPQIKKFKYDKNIDENIDDVEMQQPARRRSVLAFRVPGKSRTKSSSSTTVPWSRSRRDADENAVYDDDSESREVSDDTGHDSDDEEYPLSKAQTNLALPSTAQTGVKFNKRAITLDVNPLRRPSLLPTTRTFDRMFHPGKKKRGKLSRKFSSVRDDDDDDDDDEDDDEDDDDDDDDDDEEDDLSRYSSRNAVTGNYLSWTPTVARNSTFVALTDPQKEELGGVEYRAVKLLSKIVVTYYFGFHLIAVVCFLPFILKMPHYSQVMREDGIAPTWWGFFTPASVFNDLGYTLNPDSMFPFYKNAYVLLISGFFIIIGNTGFPIFLRFLIWLLFKCAKQLSLFKESLGFLLDHPRRCFTLLFPSVPTWWLFFILVALNAVDLVLFIILDLNNESLTSIPVGYRIVDGLFQAFSTRTAGFGVINLSDLHPSVQVSYMLMMYISVLPLAISIRRTNVYEEQSLGIYSGSNDETDPEATPKTFVATHLRNQLSFDLWFIFLGLFIICIADGSKLEKDSTNFTVFQVLFEIVSAYGTVGLSLGYPKTDTSFSAQFSTISKLVIIAMMIRGRHRGLPYSLDRAIILPSEKLKAIDQIQEKYGHSGVSRSNTMNTHDSRTKSNLFSRVRTIRASLFNVGTVDHSSWLDSRAPADARARAPSHHPENITFSLARNGSGNGNGHGNAAAQPEETELHDLDSIDSAASPGTSPHRQDSDAIHFPAPATVVTRRDSF